MLATSSGIPWQERAFVSVAEAAQIVARSPDWIRCCIGEERLEGVRLTAGGPLVVAVPSLARLVKDALPVRPANLKPLPIRLRRRELRLVVDNG